MTPKGPTPLSPQAFDIVSHRSVGSLVSRLRIEIFLVLGLP